MAKLIIKLNDAVIDQIPVRQGDMAIGRQRDSEIVLENLAVSGRHATIFTVGEDSFIQDLNSTNGTFINNRRIAKAHLKNGDIITVGKHSLIYLNDNAGSAVSDLAKTVVLRPDPADAAMAPPPSLRRSRRPPARWWRRRPPSDNRACFTC
jgi:pSer/pThr/pTyr-binding forkhead associated (FHA) protein